VSESESISSLLEPLAALQRLISRFDGRGMIIGGIAASLLGKPRLTADLDAIILLSVRQIPELMDAAGREGFEPRLQDAAGFARANRVLLLRHKKSGTDVDISLGILPFEVEAVERSQIFKAGGLYIRLPKPEDLIILKGVAHRPKDMMDMKLSQQPTLIWTGEGLKPGCRILLQSWKTPIYGMMSRQSGIRKFERPC